MQSLDVRLYLAEDILTKVDLASMAVSLEVRAPFLDPRVAEYAASLPLNYKLRGRTSKYILKRAVSDLLPGFVTRRGKKGFGVPVAEWLKGKLRPLARDLLSPERIRRGGLFNADYVARMQDELLALWAEDRKSVLFITHDLEEAIALSDRVVVLSAGPATRPIGDFRVDLPRPRDVSEIRMTPAFLDLHRHAHLRSACRQKPCASQLAGTI